MKWGDGKMNQDRLSMLAQLEKEDKEFPKKNIKFLLEFLIILLRIQKKRPSDANLEIIKDTHRFLREAEVYTGEEKEYSFDDLMKA